MDRNMSSAPSSSGGFLLLLLLSCCAWCCCLGSVHRYDLAGFARSDNGFTFFGGSEGVYASSQHIRSHGVSNGRSYINLDVTFLRTARSAIKHEPMEHSTGLVEAVVFGLDDREYIGFTSSTGEKVLCCTPEISRQVKCQVGSVILRHRNNGWPMSIQTSFRGRGLRARLSSEVNITQTGLYTLYFVYCDPQLQGLQLTGNTVWKNPTGYLPGRMAPFLRFYGYLSLSYLLLGLAWFVQYARFWKDILQLQNCISMVIFLGHAEMALWYFEYANFNATGRRPMGITIWAVTIGAMRKTVSRLLVLIVSMGFGVVRPTLGGITGKVALAGAAYFIAAEALDLTENVQKVDDFSQKERILLVLPVAIIDALFILWIFTSLSRTLEKLQAKKQTAKLDLYKSFTNSLALAVLASILWIAYEFYLKSTDAYDQKWKIAWIVPAFWSVLAYVMLCVICYLWMPSRNATRYAYSEELGEDADEEAIQLTSSTSRVDEDLESSRKLQHQQTNSDVFSLDGEEDKRD